MLDFWDNISQFNTCHNLTVAAAYWLFSLVDLFSASLAYFPDAVLYSQDAIFMPLLSDISAVYSAIFNYFCQCILLYFQPYFHFIFTKSFYLIELKLSKLLSCYCSIVKTGLIYCFLFSFNRLLGVYCD